MSTVRSDDYRPTPGFQGSENSGAEVTIYTQDGDPIVAHGGRAIEFLGRRTEDENPILVQVTTSKALGEPSGTFTVVAKPGRNTKDSQDLFDKILDDDWVDIIFTRHGRQWHVMRGLIDDVRESTVIAGDGATSVAYIITGRDFGKIWELTPIWFSPQIAENINGHVTAKVFTTRADLEGSGVISKKLILGSPEAAVRGYLFGFLEELGGLGRANWKLPPIMSEVTGTSFVQSTYYMNDDFLNIPERVGIDPSFITAEGTLWDLAKQWSDPLFTELYVDLMAIHQGTPQYIVPGEETPLGTMGMTVIFRDKPFPMVGGSINLPIGKDSAWFQLPLFTIPREAIVSKNVGRSGMERFNAFFVNAPLRMEEVGSANFDLIAPLWDKDDILRHGLRRFDAQSNYKAKDTNIRNMTNEQRAIIRDWYAINPYLLSGTIDLAIGLPDIRIGVRARIPGISGSEQDDTYYVEQVSHSWALKPGIRTSLGVTRGWRGSDDALLDTLSQLAGAYTTEPNAQAGS
jgi:hypothetical protein